MPRRALSLVFALSPICAALACAGGDKAPVAEAAKAAPTVDAAVPAVVTITAKDYLYEAPDTITSGMVTLKLVNQGTELHHVQLMRIVGGKTYADLTAGMKAMKPDSPMPPWLETVAGPNSPVPGGGEQALTEELTPGAYALICVIPSTDKVPHFAKGMMRSLTVIPASGVAAAAPVADITVAMTDYAWDVQPAITAGKHTIKLTNSAAQAHEMFIIQLAPGKSAGDFLQWEAKQEGPPPGKAMGGISGMAKDGVAYLPVDLPPGNYALLCFLPDAKDGKAHLEHGMIKPFTVN